MLSGSSPQAVYEVTDTLPLVTGTLCSLQEAYEVDGGSFFLVNLRVAWVISIRFLTLCLDVLSSLIPNSIF